MTEHTRKLAYSIEECTALVGVGRSFLYLEIAAGRLAVKKAGRRSIVSQSDLNEWLKSLPDKRPTTATPLRTKNPPS